MGRKGGKGRAVAVSKKKISARTTRSKNAMADGVASNVLYSPAERGRSKGGKAVNSPRKINKGKGKKGDGGNKGKGGVVHPPSLWMEIM